MTTTALQPQPPEISEPPTVGSTKVTTQKAKDPKRVERGKRLAQISKEARERKMRAKIEAEIESEKSDWTIPITGIAGFLLAGGSVYYARAQHKRDTIKPKVSDTATVDEHVHISKKNEPVLDSL